MTVRILTPWLALILWSAAVLPSNAQQLAPPKKERQIPAPPASARIWKSLTTGNEYWVWTENERMFAQWVNITPEWAERGAYIHTECRKVGARWIGNSRLYLPFPCEKTQNGRKTRAWCRLVTKIEFDRIEANRLAGRTEGFKEFDCERCRIVEVVWKDFEWVPKEPSPVPTKR